MTAASTQLASIRLPKGQTLEDAKQVEIVNQLLLPGIVEWETVRSSEEAWKAIKLMKIRGAPAIASLAALGLACDLLRSTDLTTADQVAQFVKERSDYLITSRPTAVNLAEAMGRINACTGDVSSASGEHVRQRVIEAAKLVWTEDIERCQRIGDNGARWILDKLEASGTISKGALINVLTVCNTGSLATSGYGTALGVITSLYKMGRLEHTFYAQTSPYNQGARLTSLELQTLGIPSTMILDTAVASLLAGNANRPVHAFLAGADRVAANGDTANKLSTYQISLLCHHVPSPVRPLVIVAAPLTTLDLSTPSGASIVIEERPQWEARTARGLRWQPVAGEPDGTTTSEHVTVLLTPEKTQVWTPAFDVTPAALIDAVVTEVGVATAPKGAKYNLRTFVQARER